jgi:hypothetical protein
LDIQIVGEYCSGLSEQKFYPFFFLQEWLLPKVKSKIAINHSRPFNGWIADAKDFNKIKKKYLLSMN